MEIAAPIARMPNMPRVLIIPVVVAGSLLTIGASVAADPLHSVGRHLGIGWSDGYHSRAACPPRHPLLRTSPQPAKPVPWWMVPAEGDENLPSPAPGDITPNPGATTGPSLFRQPGEGSSNQASGGPSIMR